MELNWQNMKKIMFIVAFGIILYIALQNLGFLYVTFDNILKILTPFILGGCIAFVVNIPMKFFEKLLLSKKEKKQIKNKEYKINNFKRFISIFVSLFIIIFILVWLVTLVIPELVNVIKTFIQYLSSLPATLSPYINDLATNYPELGEELSKIQIDFSNILNNIIEFFKNAGSGIVDFTGKAISSTVNGIVNLIIGIIFTFYILMGKEKIGRNLKRIVLAFMPSRVASKTLEITELSKDAFTKFVSGQLKEAVILGLLCYIGMVILRLPYSLTISLLTTVTALIPIFGALIGAGVGVILLLAVSPIQALIYLVFIIVLQQIETNIIYPKVVGSSVGLPGIIVLVAVTLGGSLGGIMGMIVSLPIASVGYTLIRAGVSKRLKEKNIEM